MATKTINTRLITRNDSSADWESVNPKLLAGEIGIETDTNRMKIGDGENVWSDLPYTDDAVYEEIAEEIEANQDDFTTVVPNAGETDAQAIARVITAPKKGDIAVVKRAITSDKYSYTGYVYNGSAWGAMDGNYSADNVFLSEDITLAGEYTRVGNITKTSTTSTGTFAVAGKTVTEALTEIFSKRLQPGNPTQPAASISGTQSSEDLEIGTNVSKSGTLKGTLSAGSYTYGPATGITASAWNQKVEYTAGKTGTIATGDTANTDYTYSFQMGTDGNTISVKFSTTATHGQGAIAKDNLGSDSNPVVRIAAGDKSKTATATYTCYRKMFYGTRTNTDALDSGKIRALTGEKAAAKASNSLSVSIPVGAKRVIIAVPSSFTVTSVKDVNDSSAEIFSAFVKETVAVEGANGYTATNYNVYVCDYANPATVANTYKVTVA